MFLNPATSLLGQLRFPFKFALIFLLTLLPAIAFVVNMTSTLGDGKNLITRQQQGIEYMQSVMPLLKYIPQHRGLSQGFLKGKTELRGKLEELQQKIDQGLLALEEKDRELTTVWHQPSFIDGTADTWQHIKQQAFVYEPPTSFAEHTALIKQLMQILEDVADDTGLMKADDNAVYLITRMAVQGVPPLTENMGQARGRGTGVVAAGQFTPALFTAVSTNATHIEASKNRIATLWEKLQAENTDLDEQLNDAVKQAMTSIASFQQTLSDKLLKADKIDMQPTEYFGIGTKAINDTYAMQDACLEIMDAYLSDYRQTLNQQMLVKMLLVILLPLLAAYMFAGLYHGINRNINQIKHTAHSLANGDLSQTLTINTKDELAELAGAVNNIATGLRDLLCSITVTADELDNSSDSLNSIAERTNDAVTQQKEQLTLIATAMQEMSATASEIAGNAASSAEATKQANNQVETGRTTIGQGVQNIHTFAETVNQASQVVDKLAADSQSIGSVLDVIRGIAEQTNLLALNAAIEAARAGDQGRGFAVVADEVRTLASRTQESTQEIQTTIESLQHSAQQAAASMKQSQSHADTSTATVLQASEAFDALSTSFTHIADMSTQIATAAEEQSVTAEEINRNVASSNESINIASDDARQTETASEQMAQLIDGLKQETAKFNY
ncbi:MAG: methyl-accepting chemotaxis protein [Chromatiales bacterium]|jgi:methyl-accepting chemotaxis protein